MRHLDQRCEAVNLPRAYLRMDFDSRQKVRSRVVATNGEVVGIHIHRGSVLKDGDCLSGSDGAVFMVRAAGEALSVVSCPTPLDLARAAYHLGNRHVRLQIEVGRLSYQSDHVLDEMVKNLGFEVEQGVLPFEPEPGAYHRAEGHSHSQEHSDAHQHGHSHEHSDAHQHGHSHEHSDAQNHDHAHEHDHEPLHSPPK